MNTNKIKVNMETQYLFYRIKTDTGFAPNPFGHYLTLATCTPNHKKAKVRTSDYIIGVSANSLAREKCYKNKNRMVLIYIAKVSEILTLDKYFNDKRFEYKKYSTKNKIGDNIYYKEDGKWKWLKGNMHAKDKNSKAKFFKIGDWEKIREFKNIYNDIKGDRVFISDKFLYFGNKCVEFDKKIIDCVPYGPGIKYCDKRNKLNEELPKYINKLIKKYGYGKHGNPICYNP